uniref:PX domain-containing protein n=1 Tax=Parastrongyloides trichosuri TaxID=131310 RepID=A0A0N5A6J3_PARTI
MLNEGYIASSNENIYISEEAPDIFCEKTILVETVPMNKNFYRLVDDDHDVSGRINISIKSYEKRGTVVNAYIVYCIETITNNVNGYEDKTYKTYRRFSDFLLLKEKLQEKYHKYGLIIPNTPRKSISVVAKTKIYSSNESKIIDEAERRLCKLERFIQRIVRHSKLIIDSDVIEFLTVDNEFNKVNFTSVISSRNVLKVLKTISGKVSVQKIDNDVWFDRCQVHLEEVENIFFHFQLVTEYLIYSRRKMAKTLLEYADKLKLLGSCEDEALLSKFLYKLSDAKKMLSDIEFYRSCKENELFLELILEHFDLLEAVRETLDKRTQIFYELKVAEKNLLTKIELKAKYEYEGRGVKATLVGNEINEQKKYVKRLEYKFNKISINIQKEYNCFVNQRMFDFKKAAITYLEVLENSYQQQLFIWEQLALEIYSF